MDRLERLFDEFGQSPWLDNLKRGYLVSGQLERSVTWGVRGLTSNPTILQKAIEGSRDYDEQFRELTAAGRSVRRRLLGSRPRGHPRRAATSSPRCTTTSEGGDGFVSVEVDPGLAHDTAGTVARRPPPARDASPGRTSS